LTLDLRLALLERELREAAYLAPGPRPVEDIVADVRWRETAVQVAMLEEELRAARGRVHNTLGWLEARRFFEAPTVLGAACSSPPGLEAFA
jgi:hypothetical protein